MKNFRAIIGLRQAADDYLKSINNTIERLYKQGLSEYAQANVKQLKAFGFNTYTDSKGIEKISRGTENKNLYKSMTEETTEEIKKHDLYDVKKAKEHKKNKPEEQPEEQPEEPPKPPEDMWDMISDWYEMAHILRDEYNAIAKNAAPIDLYSAMEYLQMGKGGRKDLDMYRGIARNTIDYLREYESEFENDDDYL